MMLLVLAEHPVHSKPWPHPMPLWTSSRQGGAPGPQIGVKEEQKDGTRCVAVVTVSCYDLGRCGRDTEALHRYFYQGEEILMP